MSELRRLREELRRLQNIEAQGGAGERTAANVQRNINALLARPSGYTLSHGSPPRHRRKPGTVYPVNYMVNNSNSEYSNQNNLAAVLKNLQNKRLAYYRNATRMRNEIQDLQKLIQNAKNTERLQKLARKARHPPRAETPKPPNSWRRANMTRKRQAASNFSANWYSEQLKKPAGATLRSPPRHNRLPHRPAGRGSAAGSNSNSNESVGNKKSPKRKR